MRYMMYQVSLFRLGAQSHLSVFITVPITLALCFIMGCVQRTELPFVVTKTSPLELEPGDEVTIEGRGFGDLSSQVSVSGRALLVTSWRDQRIIATLPLDTPTGERLLVVSRADLHTPAFPLYIGGDGGERPSNQRDFFPLDRDSGGIDEGTEFGALEDQMIGSPLAVSLDDPNATVVIEVERRDDQETPELWVSLIARNPVDTDPSLGWAETPLWGAASHLQYPTDRLEFIQMTLPQGINASAVTGELSGRVFWYHGNLAINFNAAKSALITLRFRLLDPRNASPLRLEIPPRSATLRGGKNQRIIGAWSGGTVNLSEGSP